MVLGASAVETVVERLLLRSLRGSAGGREGGGVASEGGPIEAVVKGGG